MHLAAREGDLEAIRALVEGGIDVNRDRTHKVPFPDPEACPGPEGLSQSRRHTLACLRSIAFSARATRPCILLQNVAMWALSRCCCRAALRPTVPLWYVVARLQPLLFSARSAPFTACAACRMGSRHFTWPCGRTVLLWRSSFLRLVGGLAPRPFYASPLLGTTSVAHRWVLLRRGAGCSPFRSDCTGRLPLDWRPTGPIANLLREHMGLEVGWRPAIAGTGVVERDAVHPSALADSCPRRLAPA